MAIAIGNESVAASGTVIDRSGHGYNGTLTGDAYIDSSGIHLDGSGDCVDLGDILDNVFTVASAKFSVSCAVKSNGESGFIVAKIMNTSNGGDGREWDLRLYEHKLYFEWFGQLATGSERDWEGTTTIDDNVSHHIVFNYDGSQSADNRATAYIDGIAETLSLAYSNGSPTIIVDGPAHLAIGAAVGNTGTQAANLAAIISDVRIFNRALSANEVAQLYNITRARH